MLFYNYIEKVRPKLLQPSGLQTDKLFITVKGEEEKGDSIRNIMKELQKKFPGRKLNPITIRQSVIANLLKRGNDIRVVQVFAGHKNASSTERYKENRIEELQAQVNKYHPWG